MTEFTIKNLNCSTCNNTKCDLYDLDEVAKNRILDMGRVMLMRCHAEIYGCASHQIALQVLAGPVVAELERRVETQSKESDRTCAGAIGYNPNLFMRSRGIEYGYEEAIKLLKGGLP